MQVTQAMVDQKREEVCRAYSEHGFYSEQYQKGFDELHDMRLALMAIKFRTERGLPPDARTPYCPTIQ